MALKKPQTAETVVENETVVEDAAVETAAPVQEAPVKAAPVQATENTGIDSDKLVFLNPLGDPSKDDTTTVDGKKVVCPTIVGYRLKTLIDLEIPDIGLGADARKNPMSFDESKINNTRLVKAGETFDLTRFEAGILLSDDRFNSVISGGDKPMVCTYPKTVKEGAGVVSTNSAVPTITLRATNAGESIRDYKFIEVLSFTTTTENGQTRKHRTINKGFEKFEPLCKISQRVSSSAANSQGIKRNKGAEAFLAIVNARKAQAGK